MALHMLGKDPNSLDGKSPTEYYDDETDHYVLQGWTATDPERLAEPGLPDPETVIEFPKRTMQFFPEVGGGGTDAC